MLPLNVEVGNSLARVLSEYNTYSPYPSSQKSKGFGGGGRRPERAKKTTMPPKRSTAKMMRRAVELRREPTPAEARLWKHLRSKAMVSTHFRRQYAIDNYIVDFYAPRAKLVIEVDGSQHIDLHEYDIERTEFLKSKGYRVLRFWNNDVINNIQSVMSEIMRTISEKQTT